MEVDHGGLPLDLYSMALEQGLGCWLTMFCSQVSEHVINYHLQLRAVLKVQRRTP